MAPLVSGPVVPGGSVVDTSVGSMEIVRGVLPVVLIGLAMAGGLRPRLQLRMPWVACALFCTFALLSTLWSSEPRATLLKALVLTVSYAALILLASTYSSIQALARGVGTCAVTMAFWALIQMALVPGQAFGYDPSGTRRLSSIFPSVQANTLAHLVVVALIACSLGLGPKWVSRGPFPMLTPALLVLALLLTRTRVALVLGGLAWAAATTFGSRRRTGAVPALSLAAAILIVVLGFLPDLAASYLRRGQSSTALESLSGRTLTWELAGELAEESPVVGLGYYAGHRVTLTERTYLQTSNLDNTWIETRLDLGAVGVTLLGLFAILGILSTLKCLRSDSRVSAAGLLLLIMGIYYSLVSFVNPTIQTNSLSQIMFALVLLGPSLALATSNDGLVDTS
jgi:exopolysaccharide production protein ExoQ